MNSQQRKLKQNKSAMAENGAEAASALEKQIIRQIEYYFGDANLKRDRFLQERVKEDDGWVSLETMTKFNRLKALTEDFNVITTALEKSTNKLIEVRNCCVPGRRTDQIITGERAVTN